MTKKEKIIQALSDAYPDGNVAYADIVAYVNANLPDVSIGTVYHSVKPYRTGRGVYNFNGEFNVTKEVERLKSENDSTVSLAVKIKPTSNLSPEVLGTDSLEDIGVIPDKDPLFVPFGFHSKLKKILSSDIFFPIFITGLSGNGKTKSVQQVCAETGRKLFRVNITVETDEDDLIGGFRLKDGNTVFEYGPVIHAMKEGAVLLIDEIDLASNKILCLQSILEGSPYHVKKTGEYVKPAKGFTIVATANTKGKGSDDGRFVGTNILNEAFLERFVITVEQEYPSQTIEKNILKKLFTKFEIDDDDFADKLTRWAKLIRDGFINGSVDELITTRRLVHIAKSYAIFGDKIESIKYCLARFDDETKATFIDSYTKIDATVDGDGNGDGDGEVETDVVKTGYANPSHPF
jgi:hypothetical protein